MVILIALLTVALLLDCVILIFLILIQLPKKEAGAGLAFGASATDALFGAGSGTVLTKITKYAAGIFFGLAIILSLLHRTHYNRNIGEFQKGAEAGLPARPAPLSPSAPTVTPTNLPATNPVATNAAPAPTQATPAPAVPTNPPSTNTPK